MIHEINLIFDLEFPVVTVGLYVDMLVRYTGNEISLVSL